MTIRKPDDVATLSDITSLITPLFLALHERGIIPLGEMAMLYEDVLARRTLDQQESPAATDALRQLVTGLHKLAAHLQSKQRDQ